MLSKSIVLFGEYLLRLTPPGNRKFMQADCMEMHWAGSEANVAVSLSKFGENVEYITSLPANEVARAGIELLQKYGVTTSVIETAAGRIGIYFYENGQGARPGKVIYDRDHSAFSLLQPGMVNWSGIFEGAGWFHWSGITPGLTENLAAVCEEALKGAKERGLIVSADFNYRSKLWQYGKRCNEIMPGLLKYCDVILADVDTGKLYFGIEPDEANFMESTFRLLAENLPGVKYIAMTMRQQESASSNMYTGFLWHNKNIVRSRSYKMDNILERIGAGDAFMAGLIYGLRNARPDKEVIEFATACGVMKHSIIGDFNLATKNEIDTIIQQSGSGKIIR